MKHCIASTVATATTAALLCTAVAAQQGSLPVAAPEPAGSTVTVTASPLAREESVQLLSPAKVLQGDELREKLAGSLGETVARELGVAASGFGAAASRPVIRGQEGGRVQVLQNGMGVADLSALSADHAVAADHGLSRQIEILRGPAALLYGSGAAAGLVNIVNDRILSTLPTEAAGRAESRLNSADRARSLALQWQGVQGPLAYTIDAATRSADDYAIPGYRQLGGPGASWPLGHTLQSGRLPDSYSGRQTVGLGLSLIEGAGYSGVSVEQLRQRYGIPSLEGSRIEQSQRRIDIEHFSKALPAGAESLRLRLTHSDYAHREIDHEGVPASRYSNRSIEGRLELSLQPDAGRRSVVGLQAGQQDFSAMDLGSAGHAAIVPPVVSRHLAFFAVQERKLGPLALDLGLRGERVSRSPDASVPYSDAAADGLPTQPQVAAKHFVLYSASAGLRWEWAQGHASTVTASLAERAPGADELYAFGRHDATVSFDVGSSGLRKESARNLEWSLMKTEGLLRWRTNLFHNRIGRYTYGTFSGAVDPESGLALRRFVQANATLRGAEAELTWNWRQPGWSFRGFADQSWGTLDGGGNLPLQPPTRLGLEAAWRHASWRGGLSVVHALAQRRLAAFETVSTPGYTQLDARLSKAVSWGSTPMTLFVTGRNLLNQDIRYSTTVEALRLFAPQPGRSVMLGLEARI